MSSADLVYDRHDHVAVVTLNRPQTLNALSAGLREEILAACDEASRDDGVRVIVWTGAGRAFCAGADLTDIRRDDTPTLPQSERLDELGWVGRMALELHGLDKPTIAAVNGVAAGGGLGLAVACDMRVGAEGACFRSAFVERGISPDTGVSFFLPRIVGYSRAADIILTGRPVGAEEAYRIGLLDRLCVGQDPVAEAVELARDLARQPPLALRSAKRVLQHNQGVELSVALRNEYTANLYARRAPGDLAEALRSFVEKRPPSYTGS